MKDGFRQSMAWLHTWSGLLVGWVLFMVFLSGTLTYYRSEITLWMKPESHVAARAPVPQAEVAERIVAALSQRAAGATRWSFSLPDAREPAVQAFWLPPAPPPAEGERRRRRFESATFDPATGNALPTARATRGGEFFYRLHFDLHYMPALWARWIVGFCAMFMLVAIVSGIVTHKRIFKDFFTFRPKKGQRSWLDAHNATAVLALPYHLMITYTGLVTLMFMYMPWGVQAAYKGDETTFFAEVFGREERNARPAGVAAPLAPVAPMLAQAERHWGGAQAGRITVTNPGDARATVSITRRGDDGLSSNQPSMLFNGTSGGLVSTSGDASAAAAQSYGVLMGLHEARFAHPLLRALFFVSGLAGCAMVATGLLLWAVKERQKHAKALAKGGRIGFGLRLVDGLNIGAIAGLPIAVGTYFWANRLLPVALAQRPEAEINAFFTAWATATVLALLRPTRGMWRAQLWLAAALIALLPVLDAATSTSHLGSTLLHGPRAVAAFDLVALAMGVALGCAAWMAGRRKPAARNQGKAAPSAPPAARAPAAAPAHSNTGSLPATAGLAKANAQPS